MNGIPKSGPPWPVLHGDLHTTGRLGIGVAYTDCGLEVPTTTLDIPVQPWMVPCEACGRERGRIESEKAQRRALAAAPRDWKAEARAAIAHLARTRPTFSADDVWRFLDMAHAERPPEPRALGPILSAAARRGDIEATGEMTLSTRAEAHAGPKRVYRSRLYRDGL